MAERSVDINISDLSEAQLLEEMKKRRAEKKAKLVTILSRGVVNDRLHVPLPPDIVGEWVPNDKMEIYRMESMGYKIDTEYAKQRALHDNSGDKAVVGDVIFMVADKETRELIEEIRVENYNAANSPKAGKQREERDFELQAAQQGLPSQIKSRVDAANLDNIKDAISNPGN